MHFMGENYREDFYSFVPNARLNRDEVLPDTPLYEIYNALVDLDCLLNSIHSILFILHGSVMYRHQMEMLASCSCCIGHYSSILAANLNAFLMKYLEEAPVSCYDKKNYE